MGLEYVTSPLWPVSPFAMIFYSQPRAVLFSAAEMCPCARPEPSALRKEEVCRPFSAWAVLGWPPQ